MIWQDITMMVANFIFAPALIVAIVRRTSFPLGTSLPTALALTLIFISLLSLELYLTASATFLTTICWYILVFQRKAKQ